ncbi:MAG: hypothetical protein NT113_24590 [Hyphomicrobiales bacterium]|jgi:hypothetical protein|nr:hypothetical protein [Hyphomicrobiales bacterium]
MGAIGAVVVIGASPLVGVHLLAEFSRDARQLRHRPRMALGLAGTGLATPWVAHDGVDLVELTGHRRDDPADQLLMCPRSSSRPRKRCRIERN